MPRWTMSPWLRNLNQMASDNPGAVQTRILVSLTVPRKVFRCAIYTRKSSDKGLDQSFNSLDAQREAGEPNVHHDNQPDHFG